MARIRTIKPEFPQSETVGKLSRDARLLFIQLWTIVDDEGRARAASRMLASLLYPYDDDAPTLINGWLDELERNGCVRRYEVDGSSFLDLPNWLKHQKIDRPSASKLPAFSAGSPHPREPSRAFDADLGPRTMDLGPRIISDADASNASVVVDDAPPTAVGVTRAPERRFDHRDFERFWSVYPHKVGKQDALKAFLAVGKRREVTLDDMLAALDRYIRTKPPDRAWCNPGTWLRQGRWDDEPSTAGNFRGPHSGAARGAPRSSSRLAAMAEIIGGGPDEGFPAAHPGPFCADARSAPHDPGMVLPFGRAVGSGVR